MPEDFMTKPKAVSTSRNTLSVDGALYERLLQKLDETLAGGEKSTKRVFRRLGYAHANLRIHIKSEGHNSRELMVASRNLSQGGISILHSSFMYNGTLLKVDLIDLEGEIVSRHGVVTRCEHRGGRVHEVGIKFDEEIHLREFLSQNEQLLHARERINPEEMNIKLMVVAFDEDFTPLLRQALMPTNLCYTFAKSEEEALEKFEDQEMILCRIDEGTMKVPELIRTFRDKGFKNPILLVGVPKNPIDMHVAGVCGADMVIPWPSDEQTLLCSIGEYIFNDWSADSLENIRSCLSPEAREVLSMEIAKLGVTLDQQVRTDNQPEVHNSCKRIRMLAPLLGLGSMKSSIDSLTIKTEPEGSIKEHQSDLMEIASMCKAIKSIAA
ncbi:MAG: PilZ domain-containing protein [Phycisphaerales bacterium]